MDMMNWPLLEVIAEQRTRELREAHERLLPLEEERQHKPGMRTALARTLVGLGLQLDPSAGEGLRPTRFASAGK
jgi:hypothetical protein